MFVWVFGTNVVFSSLFLVSSTKPLMVLTVMAVYYFCSNFHASSGGKCYPTLIFTCTHALSEAMRTTNMMNHPAFQMSDSGTTKSPELLISFEFWIVTKDTHTQLQMIGSIGSCSALYLFKSGLNAMLVCSNLSLCVACLQCTAFNSCGHPRLTQTSPYDKNEYTQNSNIR